VNAGQRQELREKHVLRDWRHGADYPVCEYCRHPFPCDVIKVLDGYDALVTDCLQLIEDLPQEKVAHYWADHVGEKW
jgi:hypothetical protein